MIRERERERKKDTTSHPVTGFFRSFHDVTVLNVVQVISSYFCYIVIDSVQIKKSKVSCHQEVIV